MTMTINKTEQAVEQLIQHFAAAWNTHDASAFASLFAENADFTNVFGQKAHGRIAIEKIHTQIFATMLRESKFRATGISVRLIGENLLAVDVHWNMIGAITPQGKPWPVRNGLMNLVLQYQQATLFILLMHNMDLVTGMPNV